MTDVLASHQQWPTALDKSEVRAWPKSCMIALLPHLRWRQQRLKMVCDLCLLSFVMYLSVLICNGAVLAHMCAAILRTDGGSAARQNLRQRSLAPAPLGLLGPRHATGAAGPVPTPGTPTAGRGHASRTRAVEASPA
uniref:Uncharacterized protein n=1 Tax=Zea mays TaxID=4577 RepID=C0PFM6_MAIZE|nr:unknown [Zea mays]